jgi:hypothetical protein
VQQLFESIRNLTPTGYPITPSENVSETDYSRDIQTTFIEQEEAVEETKSVSPTPDITVDHNNPKPAPKTEPLSTHKQKIENINTKIIEDKIMKQIRKIKRGKTSLMTTLLKSSNNKFKRTSLK